MQVEPEICYLCGLPLLDGQKINDDHVPPKQFFPKEIREKGKSNLLTFRVHVECNASYAKDEEYFRHSLVPLAQKSTTGALLLKKIAKKHKEGVQVPLNMKVLREFDRNPSGLVLPGNKVVKRSEGSRIFRIIWKITKGVFFHETGRYLPDFDSIPIANLGITTPEEGDLPEEYSYLSDIPPQGAYPSVFLYKLKEYKETEDLKAHVILMLIWDRLATLVMFHDPSCGCPKCC